jgi:hypothetical protein
MNFRGTIRALLSCVLTSLAPVFGNELGQEVSISRHLQDGEEFKMPIPKLIDFGEKLFSVIWTSQEGGRRPQTKGTGGLLTDLGSPLTFPRAFNRISGPDANSCAGCHNSPFGVPGGGGDIVTNVFVFGQRFDFLAFDHSELLPTKSALDERHQFVTLQSAANSRSTLGMSGSSYMEMLARQITADLQAIRDTVPPGGSKKLTSKGISFGTIARNMDGTWDTSGVEGLAAPSLVSGGPAWPPNLIIRPFHQAGNMISLRQFTNLAMHEFLPKIKH